MKLAKVFKIGLVSLTAVMLMVSVGYIALAADNPITIHFVTLGNTQGDILDEMVAEFEKQNPGIKVEWENWPYMDAYNKYVTVTEGGSPPDCGYTFAIMLPEFVEKGALIPVEKYISDSLKEDYYEGIRERASLNGTMWALPAWYSTNIITYRKDLLDKYGLDIPKTPEEVIEIAKVLNNPPELYGAAFPAGQNGTYAVRWFANQLWGRGGKFLTEDKKRAAFNSEAGIESLKYLTNLEPYFQVGYLAQGEHEVARLFEKGKTPWIQYSMGGALTDPGKNHPDWDLVPAFPPTPKKVALGIMDLYFLFKTTPERQEAAWKWLEFTQQAKYTEHTNIISGYQPTRKSAADYYMNTEFFKQNPLQEKMQTFIEAGKYVKFPPYSPKWYEIEDILQEAMQKSFSGKLSPEEALAEAEKKVNDALVEFYGE